MSHQVTIQPSGHTFHGPRGETVLAAALREGFILPYGCRNGACGSCKGKLLEGKIDYGKYPHTALSADERAAGYALFCVAKPLSDIVDRVPRDRRGQGHRRSRSCPAACTSSSASPTTW